MRSVLFALTAVLLATNAYASKARLTALSQDTNGSQYIEDSRGIFLNPSHLASMGEWTNFEFGDQTIPTTPNAEGGYFFGMGPVTLGFQMGRHHTSHSYVTGAEALADSVAGAQAYFIYPNNTIDLMVAGDAGIKWGVGFAYSSAEDKTEPAYPSETDPNSSKSATGYGLMLGVNGGMWDAYAHIGLGFNAKNKDVIAANTEYKAEGMTTFKIGGGFKPSDMGKAFVSYQSGGFTVKQGDVVDAENKTSNLELGWAGMMNPEDTARFFYAVSYVMATNESKNKKSGTNPALISRTNTSNLPVVLGVEAGANDWLTLRASIKQSILIDSSKARVVTDSHESNTTTAAAGAGLKFKKLTLDGTLEGLTGSAATGKLNANTLLANVSMTYNF